MNSLLVALLDVFTAFQYRATSKNYRLGNASSSSIVVSMTSHPERIKHAWISIESLFRQSDRDFRLVLVLAENQFPARKVPRSIVRLTQKGLELLWVSRDGRSFDHLWPAYQKYPKCAVISVDDDKFFHPDMVRQLLLTVSVEFAPLFLMVNIILLLIMTI